MFYLKTIGYSRDILLAYYLGNSLISNIYITIQQICISLNNIINEGPVSSSFIPILKKNKDNKNNYNNFYLYSIKFFFFIAFFLLIILELLSYQINQILFSHIDNVDTLYLLRISFLFVFINIFISLFTAKLNSSFKFIFPALISSITNIFSIIIIINYLYLNESILLILCLSLVLSSIIQIIFFQFFYKECRFVIKRISKDIIKNEKFNELKNNFFNNLVSFNLLNFLILIVYCISIIINLSQSHLYFSLRIVFLPIFFIGISIFFVTLPYLNELKQNKQNNEINKIINFSFQLIFISSIPIVFFIYVFSKEIIYFLLERGKFNNNDTVIVSSYLKILILSAPSTILSKILLNLSFMNNKNKLVMIATLYILVFFILAFIFLKNYFNASFLLCLLTISTWFQFIFLFIITKKFFNFNFNLFKYLFFIILISALSIYLIFLYSKYIYNFNVLVDAIIYILLYLIPIILFRETNQVLKKAFFKS